MTDGDRCLPIFLLQTCYFRRRPTASPTTMRTSAFFSCFRVSAKQADSESVAEVSSAYRVIVLLLTNDEILPFQRCRTFPIY